MLTKKVQQASDMLEIERKTLIIMLYSLGQRKLRRSKMGTAIRSCYTGKIDVSNLIVVTPDSIGVRITRL